jgi:hypothetical protein
MIAIFGFCYNLIVEIKLGAGGGTVYTKDLKSFAARLVGSNPTPPTKVKQFTSYD